MLLPLLLIVLAQIAPHPAPQPAADAPAVQINPAAANADAVLRALEARGQDLRTLQADVSLREADAIDGSGFTRTGRVAVADADTDDPTLRVTFDRKVQGNKIKPHRLDYHLSGGVLLEHDHENKAATERRLTAPGEPVDLFSLKGPLPLPIGQPPAEVRRLFDVLPLGPAGEGGGEPEGTVGLELVPLEGTPLSSEFAVVELWVDVETGLPLQVYTLDVDEVIERTTTLDNVRLNADLDPADLALADPPAGWVLTVE